MLTHPHEEKLIAVQRLSVVEVNPSLRSIPTQSILTAGDVEKKIVAEVDDDLGSVVQVRFNLAHRGLVGASMDALK